MQVELKNLKKEYKSVDGSKVVLNIENYIIKEGHRTGIIGANGAGKSTLLNIIAGLEKPTSGEVVFSRDGQVGGNQRNYKEITLVFQTPYMMRTTVEKNIYYPMKIREYNEMHMKMRAEELMEEFQLTHLKKEKAWTLSGGEKQKVALARALSCKPKLLLLDEATANTDPTITEEIEQILININKTQDTTMVFITHNLAQAKRFCDEIMFLEKGILIEAGSAIKMMTYPENQLTKKFLEREKI